MLREKGVALTRPDINGAQPICRPLLQITWLVHLCPSGAALPLTDQQRAPHHAPGRLLGEGGTWLAFYLVMPHMEGSKRSARTGGRRVMDRWAGEEGHLVEQKKVIF